MLSTCSTDMSYSNGMSYSPAPAAYTAIPTDEIEAQLNVGDRVKATLDIYYGVATVPEGSIGTVVVLAPQLEVNWDAFVNMPNAVVFPEYIEKVGGDRGACQDDSGLVRANSNRGSLLEREEEEPWRSWIGEIFVKGDKFQSCMAVVILSNAALIGLETDMPGNVRLWDVCEQMLLFIFSFELSLRIFYLRWEFLTGRDLGWNLFDSLIVASSLFDLAIDVLFPSAASKFAFFNTFMKMFRLLRILRLFRLFRMFKQLYLLASGLIDSSVAVFWVSVLCGLFLYICSILLTQMIGQKAELPDEAVDFCREKFGTVGSSMITLFAFMANPDLALLKPALSVSPLLLFFFIGFTIFGSFAMLSILTGVISEGMMEKSCNRKEEMRFDEERRKREFVETLRRHFKESDQDGDGTISREEFNASLPEMSRMFEELGFKYSLDDLTVVFDLVDFDGGGNIELEEFLDGMASFTANVSDLPMHILRLQSNLCQVIKGSEGNLKKDVEKMQEKVAGVEEQISARIQSIDQTFKKLDFDGMHAKLDKLITG